MDYKINITYHYVHLDHLFIFINSNVFSYCLYCQKCFILFSLRTFHCFKSDYALRLIGAIIDNEPITNDIFKPDENIINNSIRSKNRTKKWLFEKTSTYAIRIVFSSIDFMIFVSLVY